ncbi:unnamed protein product [Medioppia subpectinata]|uniref:Uncharacterized protein n=1 Tax=Medioppia subpectinata TaxID=1979941 RepID=A0A7R9L4Z8_9ACAR|nr:unnamed protein product [Medioppia subpectinata]CAG2115645.1 unnamed protein product [Medioppia subpectinata]
MDKHTDIRYTTAFRVKKWILFTFCCLSIVGTIIMAALASTIVDHYVDQNSDQFNDLTIDERQRLKSMAKVVIYVSTAYAILFNLLGLMGAYKEHYCMTVTYAILMTLGTLGSIGTAIQNPYYYTNTVIYLLVTILAFAFAYDLRRRRLILFSAPIVISPVPAPTVDAIPLTPPPHYQKEDAGKQYAPVAQSEDIPPSEKHRSYAAVVANDEEGAHDGAHDGHHNDHHHEQGGHEPHE